MPRTSLDYPTTTPSARRKLAERADPYYRQIGPGKTLGYIRRAGRNGVWLVRDRVGAGYKKRVLGQADDVTQSDGRDVLTFEQANKICTNANAARAAGKMTVGAAMTTYFDTMQSEHREEYRRVSNNHIVPTLGDVRIDRLTKTQIETWQAGLVRGSTDEARRASKDTANKSLTYLKAALTLAFADDANGIATDAAWRKVKPFQGVARSRIATVEAPQVCAIIETAETFDAALAQFVHASYLTGARPGELRLCDVSHFDAKRYTLRIPGGKTGPRPVTLTSEAVEFFRKITTGRKGDTPLLPRVNGERWPDKGMCRPMVRAVELAELSDDVTIYTLRHSHISHALQNGADPKLVAENCGTSVLMLSRNYAHVNEATRQATIERTGTSLRPAARPAPKRAALRAVK